MSQLQALELMTASSGVKNIIANSQHKISPINMGFNLDLMEHSTSQDKFMRANWLLPEVIADVHELAKQNLALECMSQLVQEYSDWAVQLQCSSRRLSDIHEGDEPSSSTEVESATVEVEKKIEEGVEALRSNFSLDGSAIVSEVCCSNPQSWNFISILGNPWLKCKTGTIFRVWVLSGLKYMQDIHTFYICSYFHMLLSVKFLEIVNSGHALKVDLFMMFLLVFVNMPMAGRDMGLKSSSLACLLSPATCTARRIKIPRTEIQFKFWNRFFIEIRHFGVSMERSSLGACSDDSGLWWLSFLIG